MLFLTACEDPSNVGIGLVGDQQGEPFTSTRKPASFVEESYRDITGNTRRVLAGQVTDPLFGVIEATGYLDFGTGGTLSTAFKNGPAQSAELVLNRDYRYGDTTGTVVLRLRDMPSEWDPAGASGDTTITSGSTITEFSFAASDTLIAIPLPQAWVTRNDTTLRSTAFSTSFHGFQIEGVSGNLVSGFDSDDTYLRVVSGSDTVRYSVGKTLTGLRRSGPANLPPNRILVQDGFGKAVGLTVQPSDTVGAVNRALIRLPIDTLTMALNTPTGFYRPPLRSIDVQGRSTDGKLVVDARGSAAIDVTIGQATDGTFTIAFPTLTDAVQDILLGKGAIRRFQLRPSFDNTINPVLFYTSDSAERIPSVVLTITPLFD